MLSLTQIVDNGDTQHYLETGDNWASWTDANAYQEDLRYHAAGDGGQKATWTFDSLEAGKTYQAFATWTAEGNRATNAPFTVSDGQGLAQTVRINQQIAPLDEMMDGTSWQSLGAYTIQSDTLSVSLSAEANDSVAADAVRIVEVAPSWSTVIDDGDAAYAESGGDWSGYGQKPTYQGDFRYQPAGTGEKAATWTFSSLDPEKYYQVYATWTAWLNRATNAPFTVLDDTTALATMRINQQIAPDDVNYEDYRWDSLGMYQVASGTLTIRLTDDANGDVIADAVRLVEYSPAVQQLHTFVPSGEEVLINSTLTGNQRLSESGNAIAALADGGYVVTWSSSGQDGSGWGVYGQCFSASGEATGNEFPLNATTQSNQQWSSASGSPDGSFVAVWQSNGQDGSQAGIVGRRFAADGTPLGDEFLVNTTTNQDQELPTVTHLHNGGFVVIWHGRGEGDNHGIFGRCFGAGGIPLGPEFLVNTTTQSQQQSAAVAATSDGGFVVSWESRGGGGGGDVYAQRFAADGTKLGNEFQVNTTTQKHQECPAVAASPHGGFVVTWQSKNQDGSGRGVYAQRFDDLGEKVGEEFVVNTTTSGSQDNPSIAFDFRGNFVIAWEGRGEGDRQGVYARLFNAEGVPQCDEVLVNTTTAGTQEYPTVQAVGGGYVAAWSGKGDGDNQGVYLRRLQAGPTTSGIEDVYTLEDGPLAVVNLKGAFESGVPSEMMRYELTANTNPDLLSTARILSGSWELVLKSTPDAFGSSELTVRATDPMGLSQETTFTVHVDAVNDAPVAHPDGTLLVRQDASPSILDLDSLFDDVDDAHDRLSYQVVQNSNPALLTVGLQGDQMTVAYQPGVSGSGVVVVRATDPGGLWADYSLNITASTSNLAPIVFGLADEPDPAIEGASLHLQVTDVVDDIQVASVSFWRDADHNGLFDPAADQLLGTDDSGLDGWAITVSTAGFGVGGQTYFAQATDNEGLSGNVASTTGNVGGEAVLDNSMTQYYSETGIGWTDSGRGFQGTARRHAAGIGLNTARWSFEGLMAKQHTVYVTWSPEAELASNATYRIYDGGELLDTVPVDQRLTPAGSTVHGVRWLKLGAYMIQNGSVTIELSDAADGAVIADAVRLVDALPEIGSLEVTPSEVTRPGNITLTAYDVIDPDEGNIDYVAFYRDADGDAYFDEEKDQFLGYGTQDGSDWSLTIGTLTFPSGAQTYFAQAMDESDELSDVMEDEAWVMNTILGPIVYGNPTTKEGAAYTLYLNPYNITVTGWTIDWGDDSDPDEKDGDTTVVTHEYTDGPNTFTITVTAEDDSDPAVTYAANLIEVEVQNVTPYLAISGNSTVNVDVEYTLNLSADDPGDDTILYWHIAWGDGDVENIAGDLSTATHTYDEGDTAPVITATATDEDGTYATGGNTAAGTLDESFGNGGLASTNILTDTLADGRDQYGRSMVIQPSDGKIIVAGDGEEGQYYLVRYNTNGDLDTSFGVEGKVVTQHPALAVALQGEDEKIITVGSLLNGDNNDFSIARYDAEGNLDLSFGTGGVVQTNFSGSSNDLAQAVVVQSDGKIVVAGSSEDQFAVARYQANGALDIGFGDLGKTTFSFPYYTTSAAYAVTIDQNGQIVVAGTAYGAPYGGGGPPPVSSYDFAVARLNVGCLNEVDGTLDTDFSGDGMATVDINATMSDTAYAVTIQSDNKIVLAGTTGSAWSANIAVARFQENGNLDSSFSGDGKLSTSVGWSCLARAVAIQTVYGYEKIVVAGKATTFVGDEDYCLVRYNTDGSVDYMFYNGPVTTNISGSDGAHAIAIQPSNNYVVVAGYSGSTIDANGFDFSLARYTTIGMMDSNFDNDGKVLTNFNSNDFGYAVAQQTVENEVKTILAGYSTTGSMSAYTYTDFSIARLNSDGLLDPDFGEEGIADTDINNIDYAYAVAVQPSDGKIILAGGVSQYQNFNNDFGLTRYTADGELDTAFDPVGQDGIVTTNFGGTDVARAVAIQSDGKIVAAGYTSLSYDFAIARYNIDGSLDTSFDADQHDGKITTNIGGTDYAYAVAIQEIESEERLVVAGVSNGYFALARYLSCPFREPQCDSRQLAFFATDGQSLPIGG
ncbi:MAG: hypothetical protein JXB10_02220, partial [Pirellulales bacterium]|nr:hypothetical protein [Pirellulales bacterium]